MAAMRERDSGCRLNGYEYFYIGCIEQKKADALHKVSMLVKVRESGELHKYERFELYMLSFTLEKILSVPLAGAGLHKLIDLSPLFNLAHLDLSYNNLRSIKSI